MYFAALLARTEDGWEASDTELLDNVETLSDLADLAREASPDDDTVLVLIEQEDAWFGVVRVDGVTTLSEAVALGVGGFGSTGSVAASVFKTGVASLPASSPTSPAYTYTAKLTPQNTLVVRARDSDLVSSAGFAEGSTLLRSGRLRLSNAFGSEKLPLQVAAQAQYWSGKAWVLNSDDNCTVVAATAASKSNPIDSKGAASGALNNTLSGLTFAGGQANLSVSAASPAATGSIDIALNLGSGTTDQSCAGGTRPTSTGAGQPWLRSQNGGCSPLWDRDPSARATFGIFAPETTKTVHARELF